MELDTFTLSRLGDQTCTGAWYGAFWGMLFGLLFFMPFLGAAWGAALGAISGHFADYGIGRDFIEQVRGKVKEGTSALFLLLGQVTTDRVVEAFKAAPKSSRSSPATCQTSRKRSSRRRSLPERLSGPTCRVRSGLCGRKRRLFRGRRGARPACFSAVSIAGCACK
jgi:hypothetical protein